MSNVEAPTFGMSRQKAATDLGAAFVGEAISKLSAAVSGVKHTTAAVVPGKAHGALADALAQVLEYFGCPADAVSLGTAVRGDDVEEIIKRVCAQNQIHVRGVMLKAGDLGKMWGPMLAFRPEGAVFLRPGLWKKWSVASGERVREEDLQQGAFTFYRGLSSEPVLMRDLWRAVFGKENQRDLAFAVLWGVVAAALSAASVYLMGSLVNWALPEGDRRSLGLLAAGWCAVAITSSNLRLSRALLQARVGTRVDVSTEAALVGRSLSLPMSLFKGMAAGDLSERIRGACQLGRAAYGTATDVLLAAIASIAYGFMLMTTSWHAALAVLSVVFLRALIGAGLLSGMYMEGQAQAATRGKMSGRLFQMLSGIARIKVASAEPRAFYQWAAAFANVRRAGYRASLFSGMLTASEGLFDVMGTVLLYAVLCAAKPGTAAIGVGDFVVATACLGGLQAAYAEVVRGLTALLPIIPKAERARPLLAASAEVHAGAATTTLEGNISLRHVTFHYADDDVRILDHVSLDVKSGEFVAIVGPSGCGKSTLIKLMLGFYSPSSGSVLLDGKELDNLDLRSVRSQIGAVLQGSELLPSSILFNIVGTSKKTIDDAWLAARRACIADDIERMPMKMSTLLSDRAVTISGGQKQRILIARALVREPKLVIFDEATSALDNKTQAGVMDALRSIPCTKICIAHRLSTVVNADRIIVMEKGSIVQEGTFESLMREDGLFRRLAQSQLQAEDAAGGGEG